VDGNSIWIASEYVSAACDYTTWGPFFGGSGDNLLGTCAGASHGHGGRTALGNWSTRISQLTPQRKRTGVSNRPGTRDNSRVRFLVVLAAALVLGGPASAATVSSGLYGTVERGPVTPVCVAQQPCSAPAVGAVLTFWRNSSMAGRTTVTSDGSYRVHLPSGFYTVRASQKRIEPTTVRVIRGRMVRLDFSIDTGIR